MSFGWVIVIWFAAVIVCGIVAVAVAYRVGKSDGYEEGWRDQEVQQRKGRHAASSPRRTPDTQLVKERPAPERITWDRDAAVGGPVEIPGKWYADQIARKMGHRPAHEVLLPEPGTYLPQPGRDSGAGTITWPKIKLELGDTGEMRAIGDANVAAIQGAGT